jgi:hypothetical protein
VRDPQPAAYLSPGCFRAMLVCFVLVVLAFVALVVMATVIGT